MKNNKYKILVLSDLTEASKNILKSATRVAQMINGEIEIFHVRKPTTIVKKESTLSAVRGIKDHYVDVENELKILGDSVNDTTDVRAKHFFAFGNIKNEIENHIIKTQPDMVVLGKKMSKTPSFMGDNMLSFILKKFTGDVLIGDSENMLDLETKLKLGFYNSKYASSKLDYIDSIVSNNDGPIHSYEVAGRSVNTNEKKEEDQKEVSFVFENSDQTLLTISNYVNKNKINLLVVNRKNPEASGNRDLSISELNDLAQNFKTPLLVSSK